MHWLVELNNIDNSNNNNIIDLSLKQGFQCQYKQIEINIVNNQLAGDRPVGCVQSTAKKLNLGQLQTNLESSKMSGSLVVGALGSKLDNPDSIPGRVKVLCPWDVQDKKIASSAFRLG